MVAECRAPPRRAREDVTRPEPENIGSLLSAMTDNRRAADDTTRANSKRWS